MLAKGLPSVLVTALLVLAAMVPVAARAQASEEPLPVEDETADPPEPEPEPRTHTRDFAERGYRRVHPLEGVASVVLIGAGAIFRYGWPVEDARFRGEWVVDEWARDAFSLSSADDRSAAATITDVILNSMFLYLVLDPVMTAWLAKGDEDMMWQIGLIDTETLAIIFFASTLLAHATGRERPLADQCATNPDYAAGCTDEDPTSLHLSMPSGHSAMAFGVAGLTCAHHLHLDLYQDAVWDASACAGALVLASATSVMRLPADSHWLTDVVVGGVLGFAIGYLFPALVHYQHDATDDDEGGGSGVAVVPLVGDRTWGVSLMGRL